MSFVVQSQVPVVVRPGLSPSISYVFTLEPPPADEAFFAMDFPFASDPEDTIIARTVLDPRENWFVDGVLGPGYVVVSNLTELRIDATISRETFSDGPSRPPITVFTFIEVDPAVVPEDGHAPPAHDRCPDRHEMPVEDGFVPRHQPHDWW